MIIKKRSKLIILSCFIGSLLTACITAPGDAPTLTSTVQANTETPAVQPTVTHTIVWFPPTATYTPFPTPIVTPTPDMRPKLGDILLEDDFSTQEAWSLTRTEAGSVAYGKNELTIAIGETPAYLYSIRESPIFTDFYMEISAAPSLCRDLDEYGVLLRVSGISAYYRFSLSCNGQVRLDRIIGDDITSLQPWLLSGAVPPGAPSFSRLGVTMEGESMHFFVNGQFQFSATDRHLTSGGVGVFARSTDKQAVTVNFSELIVYEISE